MAYDPILIREYCENKFAFYYTGSINIPAATHATV